MKINEIYNRDCCEGMEEMVRDGIKVDLILTDPPYLLKNESGIIKKERTSEVNARMQRKKSELSFIANDFDYNRVFEMFLRLQDSANMLIFCSNAQLSRTMRYFEDLGFSVTCLVWNKINPIPTCNNKYLNDIEFIVYVRGKNTRMNTSDTPYDYKRKVFTSGVVQDKDKFHPTQKNVEHLYRLIMLHCKEGGLVFDPFMGSGSTAIAAISAKRDFLGFELNTEYYNKSLDRIARYRYSFGNKFF